MSPAHARRALLIAIVALVAVAPAAEAAPKRVVALTPFAANTLAEVGVRPVAIGQTLGGSERFHRRLRGVRSLPLAHPNGPNLEQLTSLRPGLVFSSPTWRKSSQTMRRLGMRVEEADPARVSQVGAAVRGIGRLVGRSRQARGLAIRIAKGVQEATAVIDKRPRVLMILGVGRTPYAFLPNSWGGDIVTRAGARLVTAGVKSDSGFARISDEKVVEEDPDIILAVPHANPDDLDEIERAMKANELWKLTKAGQTGNIHVSNDNSLLQAGTDVPRVIRLLREQFLKNL